MPRRVTGALAFPAILWLSLAPAQEKQEPVGASATLELLLPAGATATADGKELADPRLVTVDDLKPTDVRRVRLAVKFPDGSADERLVDVSAGQRLPIPVPRPGPDKASVVAIQTLGPITASALSRDARFIASAVDGRSLVVWDTAVGRPVRTLLGHQKTIQSLAFSPDSKQLLSGSADTTAVLWDPATGEQVRTFRGHTGPVRSVAFSPDGARVLTGSEDRTAILWNARTGEQLQQLKGHFREVMAVGFSPDGMKLATSSGDRSAALWEAETGLRTVTLRGHREEVACIAFSPDGTKVVTGSYDDTGVLWDVTSGNRIRLTARHGTDIYSVAFTPDGRRVVTGERQELIQLSDTTTGTTVRQFIGHTADVHSLSVSPDGRMFLSGSKDGTARLWDLATGRELLTLTTDAGRRGWAVASPEGLFDASDPGRRLLGFRFPKPPSPEIDRFFEEGFRPGLLTEVVRRQWPAPEKPLGRSRPPLVKFAAPKVRVSDTQDLTVAVDVTDQGGGISPLVVEVNGARVTVPTKSESAADGKATRVSFNVSLAPGPNKVRVRVASADGSWESKADLEVTHPRTTEHRSRMYVIAVGVGNYAEKSLRLAYPAGDARALAELLRARGGKLHDRVDVIPLLDTEAKRTTIEDAVRDVAELTRPQDTLVVILCGHGAFLGDRLHFAPHDLHVGSDRPDEALRTRGLPVYELAAAMATARALRRVLIVDTASSGFAFGGAEKDHSEGSLRGAVERLSRSQGVQLLVATGYTNRAVEFPELGHGVLSYTLLAASGIDRGPLKDRPMESATGEVDVMDWFHYAAGQAGPLLERLTGTPQGVQSSSQANAFPILVLGK
jgi:dipeptidyl aminopeptidase/acylaminoacyl peptidase